MSSRHNYTNPAFCQQSEFTPTKPQHPRDPKSLYNSSVEIQRNQLTRSYNRISSSLIRQHSFACHGSEKPNRIVLPPKPGPKPDIIRLDNKYASNASISGARYGSVASALDTSLSKPPSGQYALVPVEEIPLYDKGRYAIFPVEQKVVEPLSKRAIRSQENLDRCTSEENEEPANLSDQFFSLPPQLSLPSQTVPQNRLKNAFSSDFGSKSFILYDQKSNQRYEVVHTEDDEELVDPNHEIIQMHNGRAHRYAVIPTDDDETCLNEELKEDIKKFQPPAPSERDYPMKSHYNITPQKTSFASPKRNPLATQMLHELLSTPKRQESTPRSSPQRLLDADPKLISSTPKRAEFKPQKLQYDHPAQSPSRPNCSLQQQKNQARAIQIYDQQQQQLQQQFETAAARTTAVISPRLNVNDNGIYGETTTMSDQISKSWQNASFQKIAHASATIGAVSLMLILCGFMNSGLSLYFTSKIGREYYLDAAIFAGFAAVALGMLGFKSRRCDWLPNRNYVSGKYEYRWTLIRRLRCR